MKTIVRGKDDYTIPADDFTNNLAYNGLDTAITFDLWETMDISEEGKKVYKFERALLGPVMTMMGRGLRVDEDKRKEAAKKLKGYKDEALRILHDLTQHVCGKAINPNSPKQLHQLFFEDLCIPKQFRSKKGVSKVSTDRSVLEAMDKKFKQSIPFCRLIILIRTVSKQITVLDSELHEGRWIAGYNVAGTDTGRWSSAEHPLRHSSNVQNLPPAIRDIFVAEEGHLMAYCDLKSAESIAVAFLSGDENYMEAVKGDIHTQVASMVFGVDPVRGPKGVDALYFRDFTYRDISKRGGHLTNYGGTARTACRELRVDYKIVEAFQRSYFRTFPGIKEWHMWTQRELQTKQKISGPTRSRVFYERPWNDTTWRGALAFAPQSMIADVMSKGLLNMWLNMEPEVQLNAMIHDAVVINLPEKKVDELLPRVLEYLTVPVKITDIHGVTRETIIPLDAVVGTSWGK
jgi:DNA polymerase-1